MLQFECSQSRLQINQLNNKTNSLSVQCRVFLPNSLHVRALMLIYIIVYIFPLMTTKVIPFIIGGLLYDYI